MIQYTPEKPVAISRYQNYFPTLLADAQQDTYTRIAELIEEEKRLGAEQEYVRDER